MAKMDIKRVCRLCCASNEVKHSLFTPNEDGVSLAEELRILTDIEITKEDHLSESICANCYRVNNFFKEFRKNCSDVNDYLKKLNVSEKSLPCDVIIKEEQLDDYEDQSADPVGKQREGLSRHPDMPYPVALVHPVQKNKDLNELRSNFLAVKRSREKASSSTMLEDQNGPSNVPMRRTEKRKNARDDDSVRRQRPRVDIPSDEDLLNHVVKQEEVDISESLAEDTTFHAEESLDDPWTPHESHHSLLSENDGGHSLSNDSCSSLSGSSSDESDDEDDDSDMLMLLALLL